MSKFWQNIGNAKLKEAKSTEGGLYLSPGNYLLEIQRCKMITTQHNDEAFVAEFKVLSSDSPNPNLAPGSQPSYFINMDGKFPALSLGNVVDFMRAGMSAMGRQNGVATPSPDQIEIDTEVASAITGADNLLAGVKIHAYAFNKPTKEGRDYTRIRWSVPE